jgi:hypothetical protein
MAKDALLLSQNLSVKDVSFPPTITRTHDATNAQQQKQIEALSAAVQKASDRLELNKPTPQVVG